MKVFPPALALCLLLLIAVLGKATGLQAQRTGEVFFANGTWTAQINTATVYTGPDMIHSIQAAVNTLTPNRTWKETVNIRSSGATGIHNWDGDVKRIEIATNTILDFHGNTMHVNDAADNTIVPIRGRGVDNIEIRNLVVSGNPRYGIWLFGCVNVVLENIRLSIAGTESSSGPGLGIRVESRNGQTSGRWSGNVALRNIFVESAKGHAVEIWGTDGLTADKIVSRSTGGCGLLINGSRNVHVGLVDSYRANRGGGYAAFRAANNAGPNIVVDKVIARECGRGVFTVSGSHGVTVHEVDIARSTSHGILIEDTQDTVINGGVVVDCGAEGVRITSRSSTDHHPTRNVTVRNLRVSGCSYGLRETLPRTSNNRIFNNDLRGNATCLVYQGPETIAAGNICSDEGRMNDLYEAWVDRTYPLSGMDFPAPEDDPRGEGLPNLLRYALDLDLTPGRASLPVPEIHDGRLSIRFWRDIGKSDIVYLVEASSDLIDWSQIIYDSRGESQAAPGKGFIQISDLTTTENAARRALRLRIERNE
jgi:hypothetical protein